MNSIFVKRWAALCAVTLIGGCGKMTAESQASPLPPRPTPKAHKLPEQLVKDKDTPATQGGIQLTGRSQAHQVSNVSPAATGVIKEVRFQLGDMVKAGQLLARIDPAMPRLKVYQASAALKLAQAQATGARREANRLRQAVSHNAVPQAKADMADTQADAAEAQVEVAKAALAQARQYLRDMEVRAPFAGQITNRLIDPGERINGVNVSVIAQLQSIDPLDIVLDAPAHLLTTLKEGSEVHLRFPSTQQEADAKISRIVRTVSPRSGSFKVVLELPNPEGAFVAGSFVEGRLPSPPASAPAAPAPGPEGAAK